MSSSVTLPASTQKKNIRVISFAVALPSELLGPRALEVAGIVGTLTLLGDKSVMVWFGLGQLVHSNVKEEQSTDLTVIGTGMMMMMILVILCFNNIERLKLEWIVSHNSIIPFFLHVISA